MQSSGQNIRSAREVLEREQGVAYFASLIETIAEHKSRDAFAELFKHFAPRLKGYLMRLGSSDPQAEEIAQEAMLTVWRKAHLYKRDLAAPSTWIFVIARNRRIDMLRRLRYPEIDPDDPTLVGDAPTRPDEELIGRVEADKVRGALTKLPEEQRELIQLAFYKGWSHSEIARETELPLGTVKSRLRLAISRLRNELEERF